MDRRVGTRLPSSTRKMVWFALLEPHWLQGAFDTLVSLFDRVGLQENVGNTVGMVCRPCQAERNQLEAAYGRRITG